MSRPGSRLQSSNLGSRVTARTRQLRTTRLASKRCKTKGLRDATRTHAHARRQYWIGYIQDTTARLTLAEQCRRLDGRTEERPAFCNYNNNTEKTWDYVLKDERLSQCQEYRIQSKHLEFWAGQLTRCEHVESRLKICVG